MQKPSLYVTWHYTVNGTPEIAQVGLHFSVASGPFEPSAILGAMTEGELTALDTAMATLMAVPSITWHSAVRYTGLKVAALDENGKYIREARTFVRNLPLKATSTGQTLLQQSICLSWRASNTFGRGARGRMYLPTTGPNSWDPENVRMPAGYVQPMADKAALFIKDCNAAFNAYTPKPVACIVFGGQTAPQSPWTARPIENVLVGDIVDTQRRRRDQVTENYYSAVVS